jgi:hypothetical protein
MNSKWFWFGHGPIEVLSQYMSGRTEKDHEKLSQVSQCPNWDSKGGAPDYDARELPLRQPLRSQVSSSSLCLETKWENDNCWEEGIIFTSHYSKRYGRTPDPERVNPKSNGKVYLKGMNNRSSMVAVQGPVLWPTLAYLFYSILMAKFSLCLIN